MANAEASEMTLRIWGTFRGSFTCTHSWPRSSMLIMPRVHEWQDNTHTHTQTHIHTHTNTSSAESKERTRILSLVRGSDVMKWAPGRPDILIWSLFLAGVVYVYLLSVYHSTVYVISRFIFILCILVCEINISAFIHMSTADIYIYLFI